MGKKHKSHSKKKDKEKKKKKDSDSEIKKESIKKKKDKKEKKDKDSKKKEKKDKDKQKDKDKSKAKEVEFAHEQVKEKDMNQEKVGSVVKELLDKDKIQEELPKQKYENGQEQFKVKENGKEIEKTKDQDNQKEKEQEQDYQKQRDKEKEKDKDKTKEKEKEREKAKGKEKKDKEKERDKEKEKEKEREEGKKKQKAKDKEKDEKRKSKKKSEKKKKSSSKSLSPATKLNLEEQKLKKEEQNKKLRLAKARLLQFENSDYEDNEEGKLVYKDPEVLEPVLPADEQFFYDWTRRNEKEQAKKQEDRCRKVAKALMYDSDGLEMEEESEPEPVVQQQPPKKLASIAKLKDLQKQKPQQVKHTKKFVPDDDEEEDPLEAFMKQVESEACKQADDDEKRRKEEEDKELQKKQIMEEEMRKMNSMKVISYNDIVGGTANDNDGEAEKDEKEMEIEEDNDDEFYEQFMREVKKKELEEKMRLREDEDEQEDVDLEQQQMLALLEEEPDIFDKQKKLEKKDLKPVDHSQIDYIPFRKNFYREVSEIAALTPDEVKKLRQQLGDIKVRGKDPQKPIQNWYQCGLSDRILNVLIEKKKFLTPFPIQAQSVPCIMAGRDYIGIAETGSGKTLAFVLPMLRHVLDQPSLKEGDGPIAIIMAPTRELAHQIYSNCKSFTNALKLNVVCCVGGAGIAGQLSELKRGAEIVVCTPGRMIDVLTTSNGKITNLRRVTYVVIDEADRMFDLGFEPQIYKILNNIRPDRQLVMFSATFPKNVEQLAKRVLRKPIECIVGGRGQAGGNIEQIIEFMEESDKLYKLLLLFQEWYTKGSILIFVEKQNEADDLFKELVKYGYQSYVLHGGMDPQDREFTIHDFKKGLKTIMVATSVLARGLDIKQIVLVINFQCPNHMEDYVHRIGRTGRAGQKGTAITFFTPADDQYAGDLIYLLEKSEQPVPEKLREFHSNFLLKVKKGEAKMFKNRNKVGHGYTFGPEEEEKMQKMREQLRKKFGLESQMHDEGSEDDEKLLLEISKAHLTEEEKIKKQEERDRLEKERIMQLIKDPVLKQQILSEATKAANACINSGGSRDQIANAAMDAIKRVLKQHTQMNKSIEGGIEEAMQIINEFEERERSNHDWVSYDFEINDYPLAARSKILSKDFIGMIHELTNCQISQRGTYIEPSKKPIPGQRKLFLRIEGENEYYVMSAYKEIKRMAQDLAVNSIQDNYAGVNQNSKYV